MDFNIDELKENAKRNAKSIIMDVVVVIVAGLYVFYQQLKLEKTDLNPWVLFAEAFMGIVCGVLIKQAIGENGFTRGYRDPIWLSARALYDEICNKAVPFIDKANQFYKLKEKQERFEYRASHLQGARLNYKDWFDEDGNYIGKEEKFRELRFWQKWTVRKCIRQKIYVPNMFTQYAHSTDQYTKKEMTDNKQRGKTALKNTLTASAIAFIGVYFVPIFVNWSWGAFIGAMFQVLMWVLFGMLQLHNNYTYVTQDKVDILREKKVLITEFTTWCNSEQKE